MGKNGWCRRGLGSGGRCIGVRGFGEVVEGGRWSLLWSEKSWLVCILEGGGGLGLAYGPGEGQRD